MNNSVYKTRLASNEIFSPSHKIYQEVGRAKDLSAPRYHATVLCEIRDSNGDDDENGSILVGDVV